MNFTLKVPISFFLRKQSSTALAGRAIDALPYHFRSSCRGGIKSRPFPFILFLCLALQILASADSPRALAEQKLLPPSATPVSAKIPDPVAPQPTTPVIKNYGQLPLSFEANEGQSDSQVKFLSRGRGYNLFLTPTEAILALRAHVGAGLTPAHPTNSDPPVGAGFNRARSDNDGDAATLRMQLLNSNPSPQVRGRDELPGKVNYFLGNNPKQWRTNIPTYAKVQYKDVYPGIDLLYYGGNQRQLEYDLVVAPGADPNQIKLAFDGAEDVRVDHEGNLAIQVGGGEVSLLKPHVYQEVKGQKQEIAAKYILNAQQASDGSSVDKKTISIQVGIQVAAYDRTKTLTIDPVLSYSTYLGGGGNDTGYRITVDVAGSTYVTGWAGSGFPTLNAIQGSYQGGPSDAFVTKLNPSGTALVYSTYLGGSNQDFGYGIAVDSAGNAYVTGYTASNNFPMANAIQGTHGSVTGCPTCIDIFVRDTVANTTTRVSVNAGGTQANSDGFEPAISGNGRYVAFRSTATNLVTGDSNGAQDIFVQTNP